jgi:hypothetical protein
VPSSPIVDIWIHTLFGRATASAPSLPRIVASTASASLSMVTICSADAAA